MVASALTFPTGDLRRIQLPNFRGPEGLGSWRLICPRQKVRIWDPSHTVDGADPDGFWPVQAVFVGCEACSLGSLVTNFPAYKNDGLSRCAIYLDAVFTGDGSMITNDVIMEYRIKVSAACVPEILQEGTITFTSADYSGQTINKAGLIGSVSGIIGNQFEFWAKIDAGVGAKEIVLSLQFIVDRIGDRLEGYQGVIAGGPGGLPLVGGT